MTDSKLINSRVAWGFKCEPAQTGGKPISGSGVVHAIGFDHGEDTWQDFMALVELNDGRLISIPVTASNMRVCKGGPTA